jgi:chromatin remodeling complex protein RSC6
MMKLTVPFLNFENAPKNKKKGKLKLKYNYYIINGFSSKTTSSTYPTQGSLGQIRPTYCFLKKKKQRKKIKISPHLSSILGTDNSSKTKIPPPPKKKFGHERVKDSGYQR